MFVPDNKPPSAHHSANQSIVMVAVYEVLKGAVALLVAFMVWRWHTRLPELMQGFINGLHHVIGSLFAVQLQQFSQFADKANQNWHNAFWLVTVYALLRFIEAYGLYRDKTWAYWYSVLGYGIFVPVELYYLLVKPFDWVHLGIFLLNVFIVVVVYRNMTRKGLL